MKLEQISNWVSYPEMDNSLQNKLIKSWLLEDGPITKRIKSREVFELNLLKDEIDDVEDLEANFLGNSIGKIKVREVILMGNNSLLVIFGTETGNAEELAEDAANMAKGFDLEATVMDMEDIEPDDISTSKRLIVVCSTWGEGEQPVNAQDLYDAVEETEEGSMEGVNFAVLALGDTAFEMFCESGKEWDKILEEKGGNRVNDRIDCDTDYDDYAEEWLEATLGLMKEIS